MAFPGSEKRAETALGGARRGGLAKVPKVLPQSVLAGFQGSPCCRFSAGVRTGQKTRQRPSRKIS